MEQGGREAYLVPYVPTSVPTPAPVQGIDLFPYIHPIGAEIRVICWVQVQSTLLSMGSYK